MNNNNELNNNEVFAKNSFTKDNNIGNEEDTSLHTSFGLKTENINDDHSQIKTGVAIIDNTIIENASEKSSEIQGQSEKDTIYSQTSSKPIVGVASNYISATTDTNLGDNSTVEIVDLTSSDTKSMSTPVVDNPSDIKTNYDIDIVANEINSENAQSVVGTINYDVNNLGENSASELEILDLNSVNTKAGTYDNTEALADIDISDINPNVKYGVESTGIGSLAQNGTSSDSININYDENDHSGFIDYINSLTKNSTKADTSINKERLKEIVGVDENNNYKFKEEMFDLEKFEKITNDDSIFYKYEDGTEYSSLNAVFEDHPEYLKLNDYYVNHLDEITLTEDMVILDDFEIKAIDDNKTYTYKDGVEYSNLNSIVEDHPDLLNIDGYVGETNYDNLTEEMFDLSDFKKEERDGQNVYIYKDGTVYSNLNEILASHPETFILYSSLLGTSNFEGFDESVDSSSNNSGGGRIDINNDMLAKAVVFLRGAQNYGRSNNGWESIVKNLDFEMPSNAPIIVDVSGAMSTVKNMFKGEGGSAFLSSLNAQVSTLSQNLLKNDEEYKYLYNLYADSYLTLYGNVENLSSVEMLELSNQFEEIENETRDSAFKEKNDETKASYKDLEYKNIKTRDVLRNFAMVEVANKRYENPETLTDFEKEIWNSATNRITIIVNNMGEEHLSPFEECVRAFMRQENTQKGLEDAENALVEAQQALDDANKELTDFMNNGGNPNSGEYHKYYAAVEAAKNKVNSQMDWVDTLKLANNKNIRIIMAYTPEEERDEEWENRLYDNLEDDCNIKDANIRRKMVPAKEKLNSAETACTEYAEKEGSDIQSSKYQQLREQYDSATVAYDMLTERLINNNLDHMSIMVARTPEEKRDAAWNDRFVDLETESLRIYEERYVSLQNVVSSEIICLSNIENQLKQKIKNGEDSSELNNATCWAWSEEQTKEKVDDVENYEINKRKLEALQNYTETFISKKAEVDYCANYFGMRIMQEDLKRSDFSEMGRSIIVDYKNGNADNVALSYDGPDYIFYDSEGNEVNDSKQIALYIAQLYVEADAKGKKRPSFIASNVSETTLEYAANIAKIAGSDSVIGNVSNEDGTFQAGKVAINEIDEDVYKNAVALASYGLNKYGNDEWSKRFYLFNDEGAKLRGFEVSFNRTKDIGKDVSIGEWLGIVGHSLGDGLNSWAEGYYNLFNADGKTSATDYMTQYYTSALQKYGTFYSGTYQVGSSIGNMLPSMAAGILLTVCTGGAGAGAFLLKAAHIAATFATMGLSVAGNAKEQAMQQGMSSGKATVFGLIEGLSETLLEVALGSIPGISQFEKLTEMKGLTGYICKMISEGAEESVQEVFDSYLTAWFNGESVEIDWNQVLQAGIYGAITAGILNGGSLVIEGVSYTITGDSQSISFLINKYAGADLTVKEVLNGFKSDLKALSDSKSEIKKLKSNISTNEDFKNEYAEYLKEIENTNNNIKAENEGKPWGQKKLEIEPMSYEEFASQTLIERVIQNAKIKNVAGVEVFNLIQNRNSLQNQIDVLKEERKALMDKLGMDENQIIDENFTSDLSFEERAKLETEIMNYNAKIAELNTQVNSSEISLYDKYTIIVNEFESLRNGLLNGSIEVTEDTKNRLTTLRTQAEIYHSYIGDYIMNHTLDMNSSISTLASAIESMETQRNEIELSIKEKQESLNSIVDSETRTSIEADIKSLQERIKAIDIRTKKYNELLDIKVVEKVKELNAQNIVLEKDLDSKNIRLGYLESDLKKLNYKKEYLEAQEKNQKNANKSRKILEQIEAIKDQILNKEKNINSVKADIESIQSMIDSNNATIENLKAQNYHAITNSEALRENIIEEIAESVEDVASEAAHKVAEELVSDIVQAVNNNDDTGVGTTTSNENNSELNSNSIESTETIDHIDSEISKLDLSFKNILSQNVNASEFIESCKQSISNIEGLFTNIKQASLSSIESIKNSLVNLKNSIIKNIDVIKSKIGNGIAEISAKIDALINKLDTLKQNATGVGTTDESVVTSNENNSELNSNSIESTETIDHIDSEIGKLDLSFRNILSQNVNASEFIESCKQSISNIEGLFTNIKQASLSSIESIRNSLVNLKNSIIKNIDVIKSKIGNGIAEISSRIDTLLNNLDTIKQETTISNSVQGESNLSNIEKNYKFDFKNIPDSVVDIYEDMVKNIEVSESLGNELNEIFSDQNYVYGIHRAGIADPNSIISNGLYLTGHISSGAVVNGDSIDLERNISFYNNSSEKQDSRFLMFMNAISSAANYKTINNVGNAIIIRIPKSYLNIDSGSVEINNKFVSSLIDILDPVTPKLKPEFVLGSIEVSSENGKYHFNDINYNQNAIGTLDIIKNHIVSEISKLDLSFRNILSQNVNASEFIESCKQSISNIEGLFTNIKQASLNSIESIKNSLVNLKNSIIKNIDVIKSKIGNGIAEISSRIDTLLNNLDTIKQNATGVGTTDESVVTSNENNSELNSNSIESTETIDHIDSEISKLDLSFRNILSQNVNASEFIESCKQSISNIEGLFTNIKQASLSSIESIKNSLVNLKNSIIKNIDVIKSKIGNGIAEISAKIDALINKLDTLKQNTNDEIVSGEKNVVASYTTDNSKLYDRVIKGTIGPLAERQISLAEFRNHVNSSVVQSEIDFIRKNNLYSSSFLEHDQAHVIGVLQNAIYIGSKLGLSDNDMKMLIKASTMHDCGASFNSHENHGLNGIKITRNILLNEQGINGFSEEQINMIAAAVGMHDISDSKLFTTNENGDEIYSDVFKQICGNININPNQYAKVLQLTKIVKDADALERTRFADFGREGLDTNRLRFDVSKDIIEVASNYTESVAKMKINKLLQDSSLGLDNNMINNLLNMGYSYREILLSFEYPYYAKNHNINILTNEEYYKISKILSHVDFDISSVAKAETNSMQLTPDSEKYKELVKNYDQTETNVLKSFEREYYSIYGMPNVEVAKTFNDPIQFLFSTYEKIKFADFYTGKESHDELSKKINNFKESDEFKSLFNINPSADPYSPFLLNEEKLLKALEGKISKADLLTYKKLKSNQTQLTELQKNAIKLYTKSFGPYITSFIRGKAQIFRGNNVDSTNIEKLKRVLKKAFDANNDDILMKAIGFDLNTIESCSDEEVKNILKRFVKIMDDVIEMSPPVSENIIVVRGVDSLYLNNTRINPQIDSATGAKVFPPGTRFNDKAFVSTSAISSGISGEHSMLLEIVVPKGTKAAYIETNSGVRLYGQQEVLLPRNTTFEVTGYRVGSDGKPIIQCKIVEDSSNMTNGNKVDNLVPQPQNPLQLAEEQKKAEINNKLVKAIEYLNNKYNNNVQGYVNLAYYLISGKKEYIPSQYREEISSISPKLIEKFFVENNLIWAIKKAQSFVQQQNNITNNSNPSDALKAKQLSDLESFINEVKFDLSNFYSKYVDYGVKPYDTLKIRQFLEERYRKCKNLEVMYWQGGFRGYPYLPSFNPSDRNLAFMNFAIGEEKGNVPFANSYKIYVPANEKSFNKSVVEIMDFLIKNNIASDNKIAKTSRADGIVLRIYDINDAKKVINFINNNKTIPSNAQGIPLAMRHGKVSVAMDGMLSYNSVSTKLLQKYMQSVSSPNLDGFKKYINNLLYKINVEGDKSLLETTFGYSFDKGRFDSIEEYYANALQVTKLLNMALDSNTSLDDYYAICYANQNNDNVNEQIRYIEKIMSGGR